MGLVLKQYSTELCRKARIMEIKKKSRMRVPCRVFLWEESISST